jgi:hypothetical protein
MKVYIGPYRDYIGPYQLAEKLCFWHDPRSVAEEDSFVDKLGHFFFKIKPLVSFLEWYHEHCGKRKIKVKIHEEDTWNMDDTLCHIIHPMLVQLKKTTHGAPLVDNEDVPAHLHRPDGSDEYGTDDLWHLRWYWVLDEMIWAFESSISGQPEFYQENGRFDLVKYDEYYKRIQNGHRLFGKYYSGLWD